VRTTVVGEFKISYGRLGPTEIRALAILLNVFMYFGGVQRLSIALAPGDPINFSPYDVFVGAIALLLLAFFIVTALRETLALRREGK
jgi:hypothetical protein